MDRLRVVEGQMNTGKGFFIVGAVLVVTGAVVHLIGGAFDLAVWILLLAICNFLAAIYLEVAK